MATKLLKSKSTLQKKTLNIAYDFSDTIEFTRSTFGIPDKEGRPEIQVYSASLNVSELGKNFVIFEDMKNVQDWPISKLIQRELDHSRTVKICDEYLRGQGNICYFPPLTAVLIPTNNDYHPGDSYEMPTTEENSAIKSKVLANTAGFESAVIESVVKGFAKLVEMEGDSSGYVVWDRQVLEAVIIDGQHRFRALMLAVAKDKNFSLCKVTVNIIELSELCKITNQSPTDVARNLFITINHTAKQVDDARIVLMDDGDAVATFTQVLVDDSHKDSPPAVLPELVDWRCEGGKHDSSVALTGVLTLRGIINSALFDNASVSSIDDRAKPSKVKKWVNKLEVWIKPDAAIEKAVDKQSTISSRLAYAFAMQNKVEEEAELPFMFSYCSAATRVMRTIFKERYKEAFRTTYSLLTPYAEFQKIAVEHKAFEKGSKLHSFLRSFKSQREVLEKNDVDVKTAVENYKTRLSSLTENQILFTVMGQKAVFKCLFEGYLAPSEIEDHNEVMLKTQNFVDRFNELMLVLKASPNFDEDFFSIKFKQNLKGLGPDAKACHEFWKGIIVGLNGELDYSKSAVDLLKEVISDLLLYDFRSGSKFYFSQQKNIVTRHSRILRKVNDDLDEVEAEKIATRIVELKRAGLQKLLNS